MEEGSEDVPYRQLIGALMYVAVGTRPDILYAVNMLSQFNVHHDHTHWMTAKRLLRYLKKTINYKLKYEKDAEGVTGYANADWGKKYIYIINESHYFQFSFERQTCIIFYLIHC